VTLARVRGDSMRGAGIESADGKVVVAVVHDEGTVKRLRLARGRAWLAAEHEGCLSIEIRQGIELRIWGVVTSVVHPL